MATANLYGNFLKLALNQEINWTTDTIKVMLCSALTIDQDGDIYLADVTKTETSGIGYASGGITLTTSISYDSVTNTIKLDANDVTWTTSIITASYALIYDDTPVTNKPVIGYIDFGGSYSSANSDFTIAWSDSGIATITIS